MRLPSLFSLLVLLAVALTVTAPAARARPAEPFDFNGDGYRDLAVGAPSEHPGGAVNVLYGSSSGVTANGDQLWTQDSPGVKGVAEQGDGFGSTLTSGDFDADGYADLAIGAWGEDTRRGRTGVTHVLRGSPSGLTARGDELLAGASSSDYSAFGYSLAAGDFDGDGAADLAVGAPWEWVSGESDAGSTYVFPGGRGGLEPDRFKRWTRGTPGVKGAARGWVSIGFGAAVAAADFDDDGRADLVVGAPSDGFWAGSISVLYGTSSGLGASGDLLLDQDSLGMKDQAEGDHTRDGSFAGDRFGEDLATGDFDGDGVGDLAVGVPDEDVTAPSEDEHREEGAVHVLFGRAGSGITTDGDLFLRQGADGVDGTPRAGERFGHTLSAGDFDADGDDDLAVSVWERPERPLHASEGAVQVFFGGPDPLNGSNDRLLTPPADSVPFSTETRYRFGFALRALDLDADGAAELAVGSPGGACNCVFVLTGSERGPTTENGERWSQDSPGVKGSAGSDGFGSVL